MMVLPYDLMDVKATTKIQDLCYPCIGREDQAENLDATEKKGSLGVRVQLVLRVSAAPVAVPGQVGV